MCSERRSGRGRRGYTPRYHPAARRGWPKRQRRFGIELRASDAAEGACRAYEFDASGHLGPGCDKLGGGLPFYHYLANDEASLRRRCAAACRGARRCRYRYTENSQEDVSVSR